MAHIVPQVYQIEAYNRNIVERNMRKTGKIILIIVGVLIILFLIIQLVPIGRNHNNPPVVSEPNWDSPATHDLARRACYDCHSNETIWPWYSNIAPISWLVYFDVINGRQRMNFSDWKRGFQPGAGEISEVILEGEMPPFQYLPMHPDARLTTAEKQVFIEGVRKSMP